MFYFGYTQIIKAMEAKINEIGYDVKHFLKTDADLSSIGADKFYDKKYKIPYQLPEYPEPIMLSNQIQLFLSDISKYYSKNISNLEKWVEVKLEEIINKKLFGKKYIDLLLDFKGIEKEVRKEMETEAQEIGYDIRQLMFRPDLEEFKLTKTFYFTVEDDKYAIKTQSVNVRLEIEGSARIDDLKKIIDEINRRIDIVEMMKEIIREKTRELLHDIDAERFYMCFDSDKDKNRPPVFSLLKEELEGVIKKRFDISEVRINPRMLETDIIIRYKKLLEDVREFEVDVQSVKMTGRNVPVTFTGELEVTGLDDEGWYKFQVRDYKMDQIVERAKNNIRTVLATYASKTLSFSQLEDQLVQERYINERTGQYIKETFGLLINIRNWNRELTDIEKRDNDLAIAIEDSEFEKNKILIESDKKSLKDQLEFEDEVRKNNMDTAKKLGQAITDRAGVEDSQEEIEELQNQRNGLMGGKSSIEEIEMMKQRNNEKNTVPEDEPTGFADCVEQQKNTLMNFGMKKEMIENKKDDTKKEKEE